MELIEIIVIIACVLIVGGVLVRSIINAKKGKSSCCGNCSKCSGHCNFSAHENNKNTQ